MNYKVYPERWRHGHPTKDVLSTDLYYSQVATKVAEILRQSLLYEAFETVDDLLTTAVHVTAWFEDIISNLGMWRVFNEECTKRYGKPLPFYDTTTYYPNEPNVQDLQFLLWDNVQSLYMDRFMNPENPAIMATAETLCELFDEEYPTAPETEELYEFLHDGEKLSNYWHARLIFEWLAQTAYVSAREREYTQSLVDEALYEKKSELPVDMQIYTIHVQSVIGGQHNILSLTPPQWLARIAGDELFNNVHMKPVSFYLVVGEDDTYFHVKDLVADSCLDIAKDSFIPGTFNGCEPIPNKTVFICNLVSYKGENYQIGIMSQNTIEHTYQKTLDELRQKSRQTEKGSYPHFLKASGGEPVVFCEDAEEVKQFYRKMSNTPSANKAEVDKALDLALQYCHGIALVGDLYGGVSILPHMACCIKAANNPYYNKERAEKEAHALIFNPESISYGAVCALLDHNLLPDANITSMKGDDYGRQFLHKNAQYLVDYFYAHNREYDL